jgi:stage V sporulation protein G
MPSRKLCDRCRRCSEKNHLKARFCNNCGARLDENRYLRHQSGNGTPRLKLHADIAHPINADCRLELERRVLMAYQEEVERSQLPGYVPQKFDHDLEDFVDHEPEPHPIRLRPTGT